MPFLVLERYVHELTDADPPPFCVAGEGVHTVLAKPFSEANAALADLHCDPGYELMEYFLKR